LDGFDTGAVVPLGSQQSFPAMGQAQPKLSIVFVMRVRSEFSALLDLLLEEVGCFEHLHHHNKSPAHRGFHEPKTRRADICSERKGPTRSGLADFGVFRVCTLRLRRSWTSNSRGGQAARRLRLINHTSLSLGAWTPTLRTRTARSAACRCYSG